MTAKRRGPRTAEEFLAELEKDPLYRARMEKRERERLLVNARLRRQEQPLLTALSRVGVTVESVWDLVNTSEAYPEAIPVLVQHLWLPYDLRIKEGIARALTVRQTRGVASAAVVHEYLETPDDSPNQYKWALVTRCR
jgi:hypothetical protein